MNESETRAEYIDPTLTAAGWGVVEGSRIRREFSITQGRLIGNGLKQKPNKADYVLQYKNINLAVIEAKASDKHHTEGVQQAKDYAKKLQVRFAYSTNGLKIYFIDMEKGKESDATSYPSPDELWKITFPKPSEPKAKLAEAWRDKFFSVPFQYRSGIWQPRYYQENAINKVVTAIAKGQQRILLTLATGTGKTAIAFQIAWKLFKAKWTIRQAHCPPQEAQRSPRVLFLTDRNILADQATTAFSVFDDDALIRITPAEIRKKGQVPKNGSVFFSIFQTFMSGGSTESPSAYFGEYPPDFFDFIIIDECHRGGANDESTWRAILEYFSPAVQLGLTATPKRDRNVDTYDYFGEPVYVYSLKDGIGDGFLTPFKVKQIDTTIDEYRYTSDDDVESGEIEKNRIYTPEEMNRIIEIGEREKYRVEILMRLINQKEKTLVFCATQLHALVIRDLINQVAKSTDPDYCHRVTADDGKAGEQYLRDFQNNEKTTPTILTTSQKLSTGVDAPEVRNIVLFRPVNSMIEFKQIIGRGTRLFDGKDYFTIYDFAKAHRHFSDPEWDGEPQEIEILEVNDPPPTTCPACGQNPCGCVSEPEGTYEVSGPELELDHSPKMIKIKLADGKVRQFQYMVNTSFWSPEGQLISIDEFLHSLSVTWPKLFKNEKELTILWSKPNTRKKLLAELSDRGFDKNQLTKLQTKNSDLYDVLAYIAFHSKILERSERADKAKIHLDDYDSKQREFLNFVLGQYIKQGVDELDDTKINDLLLLKYLAIDDAKKKLGDIESIRNVFIDIQQFLYQKVAV